MKWVLATCFLLLAAGVALYLVFADRTFQTYSGAEVGLEIDTAVDRLSAEGWTLLSPSPVPEDVQCIAGARYHLVQLRSPDYTLILTADENCMLSSIERRHRGLEL